MKKAMFFVIFTAIIIMLVGCGSPEMPAISPNVEQKQPAQQPRPEPKPEEPKYTFIALNETTSFTEWEYKVINVEFHNVLKNSRARGQYAVFIIEITNNARMSRQVSYLFELQDDQGRIFDFDSRASLDHHQAFRTDSWHLDDIGPSFTVVMAIAFDVPNDVKTLYLYPKDTRGEDWKYTSVIVYGVD